MSLRQYAEACVSTSGLLHSANIRALRNYIKQTPEAELVKEIKGLFDSASLRALWEAGVPAHLQGVYLERLNEVM